MAQRRIKRECLLAEALQPHEIETTLLKPYTIAELGGTPGNGRQTTEFTVTLENIGASGARAHSLRLVWDGTDAMRRLSPAQGRPVTEMAACGIACAVLWHYTALRVEMAAQWGEGFDYWVTDGEERCGLEVSGTQSEDAGELHRRHREKCEQLMSSLPVGGYVVVVGFARREIVLSYHAPEEAAG